MKRSLVAVLFFGGLLLLWELLHATAIWSPVLLPSPGSVIDYLGRAIVDGTIPTAGLVTLRRLIVGYLLGLALGLPLGLLNARFQHCEDTLGVVALGFQTLPSVCWVRWPSFGSVRPRPPCFS